MKLVIVESPAKCTTIKKYLGDNYNVVASIGHITELAICGKGGFGVDVDNNFEPKYKIIKEKKHIVNELIGEKNKCDEVILATDPDREGEAIAWHLANALNLDISTTKRLEFHEITRNSISEAINNPRTIDLKLVESQEARRIIDRIIGFSLSSLIYKKIKSQSAGRVQTAALKLICEQDKLIDAFIPEEYWTINVETLLNKKNIKLTFTGKNGKELEIHNESEAKEVLDSLSNTLVVSKVQRDIRLKEGKEPFSTSTLQQEAFNKLKFSTKKTSAIAQELYQGINVGDDHVGLITYIRTDSHRLSATYIDHANAFLLERYGEEFLGKGKSPNKKAFMAQDAHESIRPTSNNRTPDSIKSYLTLDQYNLYKLIYERTLGYLMKPKKEEALIVTLNGNGYTFRFECARTLFKGYEILSHIEDSNFNYLPEIKEGEEFKITNKSSEQKFTQPPSHFSEAKLVKEMEEVGIGRPSTYASTVEILKKRKYVESKGGVLVSTEQGRKTVEVLNYCFPNIIDVGYTANMEKSLDDIEEGTIQSTDLLHNFYGPFMEELDNAYEIVKAAKGELTGEMCPKCGAPLVYKEGTNGKFIGCSNYPTCKFIKNIEKDPPKETGELCPECGSPLVERVDKRGKKFVACSAFPKCHYIKPNEQVVEETNKVCPKCGAPLVKKKGRYGSFLGCSNYPKCDYMEKIYKGKRK